MKIKNEETAVELSIYKRSGSHVTWKGINPEWRRYCHGEMFPMQHCAGKFCWSRFNDTDVDFWLALFTFKRVEDLRYHGISNGW